MTDRRPDRTDVPPGARTPTPPPEQPTPRPPEGPGTVSRDAEDTERDGTGRHGRPSDDADPGHS